MIDGPGKKRRISWFFLFIPLFLIFILGLGGIFWYQSNLSSPSKENQQKVFVINPKESVSEIAAKLQSEGLVKNALVLRIYLRFKGLDSSIQTGDFKLNTSMSISQIAEALTHGVLDVWVTFPEGWRVEEMAELLNKKLNINEAEFTQEATEGYMFPDTYLLPKDASVKDIIKILSDNFHKRLQENGLTETGSRDLTFSEKIILASIIERESKDGLEERATIAGILLNRLNSGIALQVDATVQYDQGQKGNWWPKLTPDQLKIDSPFNTYTRPGLPPKPISNPGILSIKAAFNPTSTDYLYYLHGKDGQIHYARTLDEHNANAAKYLH